MVSAYGQCLPRTASDEVPLKLREDHCHVRHGLTHRHAGVDPHLGDNQPPALHLRQTQQAGEVLGEAAGAVDLGEDQRADWFNAPASGLRKQSEPTPTVSLLPLLVLVATLAATTLTVGGQGLATVAETRTSPYSPGTITSSSLLMVPPFT